MSLTATGGMNRPAPAGHTQPAAPAPRPRRPLVRGDAAHEGEARPVIGVIPFVVSCHPPVTHPLGAAGNLSIARTFLQRQGPGPSCWSGGWGMTGPGFLAPCSLRCLPTRRTAGSLIESARAQAPGLGYILCGFHVACRSVNLP